MIQVTPMMRILVVLSKDICPINMHEFVRRACMAG